MSPAIHIQKAEAGVEVEAIKTINKNKKANNTNPKKTKKRNPTRGINAMFVVSMATGQRSVRLAMGLECRVENALDVGKRV